MARHSNLLTVSQQAGAAYDLIAADRFVESGLLQTKPGTFMMFLELKPTDPECLEPQTCDWKTRVFEKAIRALPPECRLWSYQIKEEGPEIALRTSYPNDRAEWLHKAHHQAVAARVKSLYRSRTVLAIELDPQSGQKAPGLFSLPHRTFKRLRRRASQSRKEELESQLTKSCNALRNVAAAFIDQCGEDFPVRILDTAEAYSFLQNLINPDASQRLPTSEPPAELVDVSLCRSHIECHPDYLKVGEWFVSTLSLKMPPAATAADITRGLRDVRGRWSLVLEARRLEDVTARKIIELKQRQHFSNRSRYVLKTSLKDNPNEERLKNHTAHAAMEVAGQALQELEGEGHALFEGSLTVVAYARSEADLRRLIAEIIRALNRRDVVVIEETLNRPASYFAHLPGNSAWNVRYLHLLDRTVADLAPLYAPERGDLTNTHFQDHSLTLLESRNATLCSVNPQVGDVGHILVTGDTGSGKSSSVNHLISQFQQYNPITFGFDYAGSYKPLTNFYGGQYFELGPEASFKLPPFALPLTDETRPKLNNFLGFLFEWNEPDTHTSTEDKQEIDQALVSIYELPDPALRTLSTLASILPRRLAKRLKPWIGEGQYACFFDHDSTQDSLTLSDFQWYDFRGMRELPKVLDAYVYLLSCRIEQVIRNPIYRTRPKLVVFDETWIFATQNVVRERLLKEGLKTWRKDNGTVILATQSSADLVNSGIFEVVADSCPTKIFLSQHELDEAAYARLFHLNPVELRIIREELRPKGELLFKQPHRSQILTLNLDPKSYWLFTTNPYEAKRRDEVFAIHGIENGLEVLAKEARR